MSQEKSNSSYFKYWGKARQRDDGSYDYHLLPYHCLDVTAVGKVLLDNLQPFVSTAAGAFQISAKSFCDWFLFFLSIHDIGKFSVRFQNLCPDILKLLQSKKRNDPYTIRHDQMGYEAYSKTLFPILYNDYFLEINRTNVETFLDTFAFCFLGHHGVPPSHENTTDTVNFLKNDLYCIKDFFHSIKEMFISECASKELRNILELPRVERKRILSSVKKKSWQIAGLVTMCDWIGSGEKFKYCKTDKKLSDYYVNALDTAKNAVKEAEVIPATLSETSGFEYLFPSFAGSPSHLQKLCNEIPIPKGPQLWILEDICGSGKTEAALTLTSRILSLYEGRGCFIALPTMATSNAMYERMAFVYSKLFRKDVRPSLVLSHGSRYLSETFSQSYKDNLQYLPDDPGVDETGHEEGMAHCAQWLADSSKKALLADCGVGTVDQILLCGLPIRYQSLRVYGLWRKVLVIDEVHAYDVYMIRQLENILEFHCACGGSAILLSATLPQKVRKVFVSAYSKGIERTGPALSNKSFPLVTRVSENGLCETPVHTQKENQRKVLVNFCYNLRDIYNLIKEKSMEGKCVCWIRNTVTDVMDSFTYLRDKLTLDPQKLHIFHSRLALHDRLNVEKKVIQSFGKKSTEYDRCGGIIIASQVIEQSLDLDFDVMISDLGPIDLIIQRAGRLHRHIRDAQGNPLQPGVKPGRVDPVLHIYAPSDTDNPSATWFKDVFPGASCIYKDTAVLWRTYEVLKREKMLLLPESARELIESVYGDQASDIPDVFNDAENNSWADIMSKKSIADYTMLDFASGYSKSSNSNNRWDHEERVQSRLGDPQNTIYLCKWNNGTVVPLYNENEYPWDMSSLKLRESMLTQVNCRNEIIDQIGILKKQRRFKFDTLFVVFENDAFSATGVNERGKEVQILYDSCIGLNIITY